MNMEALIKPGFLPWSPNPEVRDLDVWDEYEHPRTGIFSSDGNIVLFTMVAPPCGLLSAWAYACLTSAEAQDLAKIKLDSPDSLRDRAEGLLDGRRLALAMAEDLLITHWSAPEAGGSLPDLATEFLNKILESTMNPDPDRLAIEDMIGQLAATRRPRASGRRRPRTNRSLADIVSEQRR
jgi:hypothetical protein